MKVTFSDKARQDLTRIGDYIAMDNPRRARSFVQELRSSCAGLVDRPLRFAQLEGFEQLGYRRRIHGSHVILYRVEPEVVLIVRIVQAAADLWKLDLSD